MNEERYTDAIIEYDLRNVDAQAYDSNFSTGIGSNSAAIFTQLYGNNRGPVFIISGPGYIDFPEPEDFRPRLPDYMSKEFNYNILDGTKPVASFNQSTANVTDIPYVSKQKTTSNVMQRITIDFSQSEALDGISMYFAGDYPKSVLISWFLDENLVTEGYWQITKPNVNIFHGVTEFDKLTIEFTASWVPDRFVKMYFMTFGTSDGWQSEDIKSAKIVQEVNPLADKLSLNTLTFEVIDKYNDFNYGNKFNRSAFFKRLMPVTPKIDLDGEIIQFGKYYIDKIQNDTNLVRFECFSAIGLLDNVPFNEGEIYSGATARSVLNSIFLASGVRNINISNAIGDKLLYGTIPPCSCREALQKVMFATEGVVRTNSEDYQLVIEEVSTQLGYTIGRDEKITTRVNDAEYVTGVELSYSTYELDSSATEIVPEATYSDGEHTVIFNSPYLPNSISVTYAEGSKTVTITERKTYYIKFTTTAGYPATLAITGRKYTNKSSSIVATRTNIKEGAVENIKKLSTSLCNHARAHQLANDILSYYIQSTLNIQIKQFAKDSAMTGRQMVRNEIPGLENYIGRYSSRVFDLAGGFIDDAKLLGYYESEAESEYYSDNFNANKTDIYSGDDIII